MRLLQPIRIGWASVKANAVPMAVLWFLFSLVVVGYYHVSGVSAILEPLSRWQLESGWTAAFLNRFVFCGLLPGVFVLTLKSLSVRHPFAAVTVQTLWSGVCGVVSGWMYMFHALLLGEGTGFWTLVLKTILCQFIWTPFIFAPAGALVYFWIGRDFSLSRCRTDLSTEFWTDVFLPNLLANWVVWIPCSMLIHLFPTPLQIQLTGFVNAYFCLVLLWIGRKRQTVER